MLVVRRTAASFVSDGTPLSSVFGPRLFLTYVLLTSCKGHV